MLPLHRITFESSQKKKKKPLKELIKSISFSKELKTKGVLKRNQICQYEQIFC